MRCAGAEEANYAGANVKLQWYSDGGPPGSAAAALSPDLLIRSWQEFYQYEGCVISQE